MYKALPKYWSFDMAQFCIKPQWGRHVLYKLKEKLYIKQFVFKFMFTELIYVSVVELRYNYKRFLIE
ncbi:MAG: hypothetical protein DBO98_00575 [Candidatus Liberibacter europaeus]|nr:hypothetical protein [Candidatus Liberibacter europaeus]